MTTSTDELGKVYEPEVSNETPFPQGDQQESSVTQPTSGSITSPLTTQPQSFPQKKVSTELLSTALNTKSKKIQQGFQFTKQGAIQVGEYQNGVSGDVKISPAGVVARDQSGNTTFALDGETGDAVFSGDVRAGTFTSDNFKVDREGNAIANSIKISSGSSSNSIGAGQTFTSGTEVDVTGSSKTFVITRPTVILILMDALTNMFRTSGSADWSGNGIIRLIVDGSEFFDGGTKVARSVTNGYGFGADTSNNRDLGGYGTASFHTLFTIQPGTHTIKLTGACDQTVGVSSMTIYFVSFSYLTLGNP